MLFFKPYMKFSAMRNLFFLLVAAVGVAVVAPAPVYARNDDDDDKKSAKAPVHQANLTRAFASEIKALTEAETMLKTISDEKSAKAVKVKMIQIQQSIGSWDYGKFAGETEVTLKKAE